MTGRRMVFAVLALGLLGSQAGHLLAYQIRFGAAAQHLQSSGAHAYFPLVAKTALGAAATALIGALLLVGLARILGGRRVKSATEPPYVPVAFSPRRGRRGTDQGHCQGHRRVDAGAVDGDSRLRSLRSSVAHVPCRLVQRGQARATGLLAHQPDLIRRAHTRAIYKEETQCAAIANPSLSGCCCSRL